MVFCRHNLSHSKNAKCDFSTDKKEIKCKYSDTEDAKKRCPVFEYG
jgi:hypothetical protein